MSNPHVRFWTEARNARLRELVGRGMTYRQTAAAFNASEGSRLTAKAIGLHALKIGLRPKAADIAARAAIKDQENALISEMVTAGIAYEHVAAALADQLGSTLTREGVISRARKLGVQGRNRRAKPQKQIESRGPGRMVGATASSVLGGIRRRGALPPTLPSPIAFRCADVTPLHLRLDDLNGDLCHWPEGDEAPFTFCGHPAAQGLPYCAAHCAIAYRPNAIEAIRERVSC